MVSSLELPALRHVRTPVGRRARWRSSTAGGQARTKPASSLPMGRNPSRNPRQLSERPSNLASNHLTNQTTDRLTDRTMGQWIHPQRFEPIGIQRETRVNQ
ncbi:UNVERIFIED_CONTAM: hypothetical protein FKN15_003716 [Acipenser sinensis]